MLKYCDFLLLKPSKHAFFPRLCNCDFRSFVVPMWLSSFLNEFIHSFIHSVEARKWEMEERETKRESQLFTTWIQLGKVKYSHAKKKRHTVLLTMNANKIQLFARSLSTLLCSHHLFPFIFQTLHQYTSHTHVYASNLVRAWSNIYFNSIEEIPYSHCPIKVLKFNIYTGKYCRNCIQYRFDSWLAFLVDTWMPKKSNRVHAVTITNPNRQ